MTPLRGDSATIISKLYMKLVMASAPDRMLSGPEHLVRGHRGTTSGTRCQVNECGIRSHISLFWHRVKLNQSEYQDRGLKALRGDIVAS